MQVEGKRWDRGEKRDAVWELGMRSWTQRLLLITAVLFTVIGSVNPILFAQKPEDTQGAIPRITPMGEHQTQSQVASPSNVIAQAGPDYVIGPEDVIMVSAFQVPELSHLLLRVANDGTVSVPLLGQVEVAGLTARQVADELQSKWGKTYLQNPEVTVFVQEFHAKPVSVVGVVQNPGLYYLTGPRKLIEVLSMAGGVGKGNMDVAGPTVYVTRPSGFGNLKPVSGMDLIAPDKLGINLRMLLYSKETALNIPIKPLDIISVSRADVVYVAGRGVQKPGGFVLQDRDSVTVFQALAMAEGLGPSAAKHDARIIREAPDGSRVIIPVDLDKLEKGQAPDPSLAANDILFVPDSAQKKALKRALESTVATVSGMLVWGRF